MCVIQVVGESGLFVPADIAVVQEAGCGAVCLPSLSHPCSPPCQSYLHVSFQVLVGESLVKQNDPAAGIAGLFGKDISRVQA